jgi:NitT/TauT family transport system substrate-binding protein
MTVMTIAMCKHVARALRARTVSPRLAKLLAATVLAGASLLGQARAEDYTIKVAAPETPPSFHNLYLQVAFEKGIFEKNGIKVSEFIQMKGGPLATQALVAGQVDATVTDVEGVLHSVLAGYPLRAVAAPAERLSYVVAVRKDIAGVDDLKGKPFAVSRPGALSQYITFPLIEGAGVSRNDIQWLAVGSSTDRLFALQADRVKGAVLYFDTVVQVKDNPDIKVLAQLADSLPDYPHELLVVRQEDIEKRPEKVIRIIQSIIEACRYMMTHKQESVDVFIKYASIDRDKAEEAYDRLIKLKAWGVNGGLTEKRLQAALDLSLQNKAIDQSIPFDQWSNFKLQEEALRRLGGPISE